MSQYISKQAIVNWIEEQMKDKNWPHEMRYAFKKVGNEIGSDRFDCHGIENVSPETREKIGKVLAEIRADKAEAELTKEREANRLLIEERTQRISFDRYEKKLTLIAELRLKVAEQDKEIQRLEKENSNHRFNQPYSDRRV